MESFSFINEPLIDFYYKSYGINDHVIPKKKITQEVSTTGLKLSREISDHISKSSVLDKLDSLLLFLNGNELIEYERPNELDIFRPNKIPFTFEEVDCHKLMFPYNTLSPIYNLNHLVVWVSDPAPENLSTKEWEWTGTFLILIEIVYDKEKFATTLSGCSALQALSNIISGKPFYEINRNESLGRNSTLHPIDKLSSLGAVYLQKQLIKTLYAKRYMTNEQCFDFKGNSYRCNDLLAYPIFIS